MPKHRLDTLILSLDYLLTHANLFDILKPNVDSDRRAVNSHCLIISSFIAHIYINFFLIKYFRILTITLSVPQ